MSSGVGSRMKTGYFDGTGAEVKVAIPEFTPRRVELINSEDLITLVHTDRMPAASGLKTVQGTPVVLSFITTGGITLVEQLELDSEVDVTDPANPVNVISRGFKVGTDSVNASGKDVFWTAWE